MTGSMSVNGLISGLNTDEIIAKLIEIRKKAVQRLEDKQAALTDKLTAWQDLNTRMLALKIKSDALANPNTFTIRSAVTDDESILTATADKDALTGTYYLKVKQIALAHQIQSQGYDDLAADLGTGDIKITVAGKETTVKIDSNNRTLVGVKDAINRANAGVKAAIVDTGAATGRYKLVITSSATGTDNAITLTIPPAEEGGLQGGISPTFTDLQAAANAELEFGSGAGAIQISSSSNTVKDVIPGVTLNLKSADTSRVLAVNISQDTEAIKKAVDGFVEQYNNVVSFINDQFSYNPDTQQAGTLFGDFSLMMVQMNLGSVASDPVRELAQTLKALSQVGIKTDVRGKLSVSEEFEKMLAESPEQVKNLFSAVGSTTDPNVVYISAGDDTKATSTGYSVEIHRLATKTRITAGVAQTENLAADEILTINGRTITLKAGWTPQQVVDEINAKTGELGVTASRTGINGDGVGDYLTLTSVSYGSAATLSIRSSVSNGGAAPVANTSGFGSVEVKGEAAAGESGSGTGALGYDVLGKINGKDAYGMGQVLTSQEGDSKGLKLLITGGEVGNRGIVCYTRGVAALVSNYLKETTDRTGTVMTAQDTLNRKIGDLKAEVVELNKRLQKTEERLYKQFMDMENALSRLQSQGLYISGLFASWK